MPGAAPTCEITIYGRSTQSASPEKAQSPLNLCATDAVTSPWKSPVSGRVGHLRRSLRVLGPAGAGRTVRDTYTRQQKGLDTCHRRMIFAGKQCYVRQGSMENPARVGVTRRPTTNILRPTAPTSITCEAQGGMSRKTMSCRIMSIGQKGISGGTQRSRLSNPLRGETGLR